MDYEKAYKEALERAKYYQKENGSAVISAIFPELGESENERMRRKLIDMLDNIANGRPNTMPSAHQCTEWILWLKRQGEQKPAEWSEEDEKILNELLDHCNTQNATWFNWLKSLKPQSHWRPSEEQMRTLNEAIIYVESNSSNFRITGRPLEVLYDKLMKL